MNTEEKEGDEERGGAGRNRRIKKSREEQGGARITSEEVDEEGEASRTGGEGGARG